MNRGRFHHLLLLLRCRQAWRGRQPWAPQCYSFRSSGQFWLSGGGRYGFRRRQQPCRRRKVRRCPGQPIHFRAKGEKLLPVVTATVAVVLAVFLLRAATRRYLATAERGGGSHGTTREVERLWHDGGHGEPRRGTIGAKALPKTLKTEVGRNEKHGLDEKKKKQWLRREFPFEACQVQVSLDVEWASN